jgi:hypothetical protein
MIAIGLLVASHAYAWSGKEHIQITRMAVERLLADPSTPPAMRDWLKHAAPGLLDAACEKDYLLHKHVGIVPRGADGLMFWSVMPDMNVNLEAGSNGGNPLGPEKIMHYIDLELFNPDASHRTYADDLSHKPKLADLPRDPKDPRYQQAGMLPFRVEQCYRNMIGCIRSGRLDDKAEQFPRDEHAARWAGFLAHYVADNTMPMHATMDYRAASYFGNASRAPNIHGDMEYRLVDDEHADYLALREEFWGLFTKALAEKDETLISADLWQGTLEVNLISYDALPLIGRAARAAYAGGDGSAGSFNAEVFFHFKGDYRGRSMSVLEMKAYQQAWAIKRVAAIWRQAWEAAAK